MRETREIRSDIEGFGSTPAEAVLLEDHHGRRYLRSWLANRLAVGLLGLLMPVLLIAGDAFVLSGGPSTRGSLSAYYHSGMRDAFVAILCVIGLFLVTYKIGEGDLDAWMTTLAGLAAVGVAVFPTWTDRGQPLTPLQEQLQENVSAHVHLGAAATFTVLLAVMSLRFARGVKAGTAARFARVHVLCGAVMLLAVAAFAVLQVRGVHEAGDYTILLIVELVCTVAFGISWLLKGVELRRQINDAAAAEGQVPGPVPPAAAAVRVSV
jgi:hypothetical protein